MRLYSRVPNADLVSDMLEAVSLLDQLAIIIARNLPETMNEEERKHLPRPALGFTKAVQDLAAAAELNPEMAEAAEFNREAVLEDIANVAALAPVAQRLELSSQRVTDAILRWNAEAFIPSLSLYGMAKVGAKRDDRLTLIVEPMSEIFKKPRKPKGE